MLALIFVFSFIALIPVERYRAFLQSGYWGPRSRAWQLQSLE
jgi:hypothetical protein